MFPKQRRLVIAIAGGAYAVGTMGGFMYWRLSNSVEDLTGPLPSALARNSAFDTVAESYSNKVRWDEHMLGITAIRWWHMGKASGKVLEVAAGSGLNLGHYRTTQVTSLVCVDQSEPMLKQAIAARPRIPTQFTQVDASKLPFEDNSFDTVVDTFGLCSFESPSMVLKEMGRVVRPGGRILLLEHGHGHYEWINKFLDGNAKAHAEKWGCIWNKDILDIVEESDLVVTSCTRLHFGTTYILELAPKYDNIEA